MIFHMMQQHRKLSTMLTLVTFVKLIIAFVNKIIFLNVLLQLHFCLDWPSSFTRVPGSVHQSPALQDFPTSSLWKTFVGAHLLIYLRPQTHPLVQLDTSHRYRRIRRGVSPTFTVSQLSQNIIFLNYLSVNSFHMTPQVPNIYKESTHI